LAVVYIIVPLMNIILFAHKLNVVSNHKLNVLNNIIIFSLLPSSTSGCLAIGFVLLGSSCLLLQALVTSCIMR
jgi:hypothetical protein